MQTARLLTFGPYRLDSHTGQLWRGKQEVKLTPKAAVLLRYLVTRAGQVVTKEELFQAVWPETVVSDAALTSCIQELRQAFHDNARLPRYIVTVHRRGFRFLGKVVSSQHSVVSSPPPLPQHSVLNPQHSVLVGRAPDLAFLHERLAKALNGERQIVFVTGEPGIGKTTLVEVFLHSLAADQVQGPRFKVQSLKLRTLNPEWRSTPRLRIGRGQCVEHYGAGEAYLPILEALGRLCREETGNEVIALLRQHAPSWLVQLPSVLSTTELEELQRRTAGVTRERMLRELAEAVEALTAERALILRLEDLHWSDYSTLDLLSMLARRHEAAQLLILGTYRPVEVLTREHPLKAIKQELQVHGQCEELALDFLTEQHVAEYLTQRFSAPSPASAGEGRGEGLSPATARKLAHFIHQRTDGNALFMVNVVNDLIAQGAVVKTNGGWELRGEAEARALRTPVNLRQLIEQQIARVGLEERKVLEAASVAGAEFSAAAVAAGAEYSVEAVEAQCDGLVRQEQFLRTRGTSEWPDGTVATSYGFVHALYQEVLYEQISASRRIRLHRQIGEREEQGYGERAREIAAELAVHFERGRDYARAVQYRQQAGQNAMRRNANQEAADHFTKGLELLKTLPETSQRTEQELSIQMNFASALVFAKGLGAHEGRVAYDRAWQLCQRIGETPHLIPVLLGLSHYYLQQEAMQRINELGEQLLAVAEKQQALESRMMAYQILLYSAYWSGDFRHAHTYAEQGMQLYDPQQHGSAEYGLDLGVTFLTLGAWALWYLGYPDQALHKSQTSVAVARDLAHPYTLAWALNAASWMHTYRGEGKAAYSLASEAIAFSAARDFPHWVAMGMQMQGVALAELGQWQEGLTKLKEGHAAYLATGAVLAREWRVAQIAKIHGQRGQVEEGLQVMDEALAFLEYSEVRFSEAEIHRLKGELVLQSKTSLGQVEGRSRASQNKFVVTDSRPPTPDSQAEAEAYFRKAIDIARKQQAKSLELRATTSLARLWQQQGKREEAHQLLAEVYGWFTEGFETKDLQEAKALLESLSP